MAGVMEPADLSEDEIRELIRKTKKTLSEWRESFKDFLVAFFPDPRDYFRGRPRVDAHWDPKPDTNINNLPARYEGNTDFIAWTWEARIHEEHPLLDGLLLWAAPHEILEKLKEYVDQRESLSFWAKPCWVARLLEVDHVDPGLIREASDSDGMPCDPISMFGDEILRRLFAPGECVSNGHVFGL